MSAPTFFSRLQAAFHDLSELPEGEREAEIVRRHGDDPGLAFELRALLAAAERTSSPLDAPVLHFREPFESPPEDDVPGYRLAREIGRGGSSIVYLADQLGEGFTRRVALKVVDRKPEAGEGLARRLSAEPRILAALEHPGIARLYDAGVARSGRTYLAMELVEGESLIDYCRNRSLSFRARIELFLSVLEAVDHAHAAGVVHRDLKPANILVSAAGEPKLLDFGISRLHEPEPGADDATQTRYRAMTLAYASPEQVSGRPVDTRSDLYSLGVVLYELLTGRRPYRLADARSPTLERAIREQEPERPSTAVTAGGEATGTGGAETPEGSKTEGARLRRALRGDLDAILLKALRKEPGARYGSVRELADDLRRHLEGRPVLARRGTFAYRLGRTVRRRRGLLVNATLALLLTAGAVLFLPLSPWSLYAPASALSGSPDASPWFALRLRRSAVEPFSRGLAARRGWDFSPALADLRAAAAADTRNPLLLAALADTLQLAARSDEAAAVGRRALELSPPGDPRLPQEARLLVESVALNAIGRREEGTKVLRSLWLLRPGNLEIGLLFARSLVRFGEPVEALDVLAKLAAQPGAAGRDPRIDLGRIDAYNEQGKSRDALAVAVPLAAAAEARGLPLIRARALLEASFAQDSLGGTEEARRLALSARKLFLDHGDAGGAALSLHSLCMVQLRQAHHEQVEILCGECLRQNRTIGNPNGVARVLTILGASRRRRGDLTSARAALAEASAIGGRLGSRLSDSRYLHTLANLDLELGRLPEAEESYRKAIAIKREAGDRRGLAISLGSLAVTLLKRGALAEAEKVMAEAEAKQREVGAQRELALSLWIRGELAWLRGDRAASTALLDQSAALLAKGEEEDNLALLRASRALLTDASTDSTCRRLESAAADLERLTGDSTTPLQIWTARCWSDAGAPERAVPWLERASRGAAKSEALEDRIELAIARAAQALALRQWEGAARWIGESDEACRRGSFGTHLLETRLLEARLARERGDHPVRVRTLVEELRRDALAGGNEWIARQAASL